MSLSVAKGEKNDVRKLFIESNLKFWGNRTGFGVINVGYEASVHGRLADISAKKQTIDYFKCMTCKHIYPLGASSHYLVKKD
jgi:hypothetical protein